MQQYRQISKHFVEQKKPNTRQSIAWYHLFKIQKSALVNRETLNIHAVKIMQYVKKNE